MDLTRKSFFAGMSGAVLSPALSATAKRTDKTAARWYRGNLHLHTLRSDGRAFPEEAILLYRKLGYDFLALTDHHVVHERERWFTGAKHKAFSMERLECFRKRFPGHGPEHRTGKDGAEQYRLRPFHELAAKYNRPGEFLLLSGVEQEDRPVAGRVLHCNFINSVTPHAPKKVTCIESSLAKLLELHRTTSGTGGKRSMFIVNHPFWPYFDVTPQMLADYPEIRFFEIANAISPYMFKPPPEAYTADRLWDYANACRMMCGDPLLFGVATDDTHRYDRFYGELFEGKRNPMNKCHVRVRATSLTAESLVDAMYNGDFYASNGPEFREIVFDRASKTLTVDVKPVPGRTITVRFIGTKKNFDWRLGPDIEVDLAEVAKKEGKPLRPNLAGKRRIPRISDTVGVTLKEVKGCRASYTLASDDLYVRAKVFTNAPAANVERTPPYTYVAWTQPYCAER